MSDLVTELQALVTSAQAALDTANSQVSVSVVDPTWTALQAALVAGGWTAPETETPAEDATDVPSEA